MQMYDNEYVEDPQNNDRERRERKKKRHRKSRDELNDDEVPNTNLRVTEEETHDQNNETRRNGRNRHSRTEDDSVLRDEGITNEDALRIAAEEKELRRQRREKKRREKELKRLQEEQYQNLQSPTSDVQDYPFESPTEPYYGEEEGQYGEEEGDIPLPDDAGEVTPIPDEPKAKKKSGGFGKIFASFKKKPKGPKAEVVANDQWQSNPNMFNPGFTSEAGTLDQSKKKSQGKSARDASVRAARVIMLDGEELQIDVEIKATGSLLFDKICEELDLIEKDFFGMTYVNSKLQTWFWLDMDKKINKQLGKDDDWMFNFQVKFYPPEPVLLQEDITRYLLSLQVRQDVFTGKLPCSWITQALLGSFMVQSELGNYDEMEHGDGIDYLREFEFVLNQSEQLLEKICELHKKHNGMLPDKADIKYLETAKRLEQYGVDLHPARDNDDVEIFIGVSYQGILIYRDRLRIGRFAWPKVLRISYKKNYFYLKIRSDRYDDSVAIVGFKVFNHNLAKRLWKNAAEQHTFFRMKEPQMHKTGTRFIPATSSKFDYSGMTLHQYRTMNISRTEPAHFDRSLMKRRTIGSMPAGLNRTGMQYNSMHSLNRAHPRDMTLGKSMEYLGSKKPGSMVALSREREDVGTFDNSRHLQQPLYPPRGSIQFNKEEDHQLSLHSGESLNGGDSYTVNNDDHVSLPPMSPSSNQEYAKPLKKHRSKVPSVDAASDDGLVSPMPTITMKPSRKSSKLAAVAMSPEPQTSDSEIVPNPKMKRPKQNPPEEVPAANQNHGRPLPQFKPPPLPPNPVHEPSSVSSSLLSSPMLHKMPPPPPVDLRLASNSDRLVYTKTTVTVSESSKPPPVKPKPGVKPKPNVVMKERTVVTTTTTRRHDDDSSNDDML